MPPNTITPSTGQSIPSSNTQKNLFSFQNIKGNLFNSDDANPWEQEAHFVVVPVGETKERFHGDGGSITRLRGDAITIPLRCKLWSATS
jgi:hypothetical protein